MRIELNLFGKIVAATGLVLNALLIILDKTFQYGLEIASLFSFVCFWILLTSKYVFKSN